MVLIEIKMFYPVEVVPTQIEPYKMVLEFQDVKRRVCLSKYDAFQQKKNTEIRQDHFWNICI